MTQISKKDIEHLLPKNELNPDIWDNKTKTIHKNIRNRLIKIALSFKNELKLTLKDIEDITITGSIANYNWSKYSDIDLHIIVDFDKVKEVSNKNVLEDYFKAKKHLWNNLHDIKIKGHEVEIYVQNKNEDHQSSGVYSLIEKKWRIVPKSGNFKVNFDRELLKKKTKNILNMIDFIEEKLEEEPLKAMKLSDLLQDKLSIFRSVGLHGTDGEFSLENLIYKLLRRAGGLDKLREIENKAFDKIMSL